MENNHPTPYQDLSNKDTKVSIPIDLFIEEIDTEIENISCIVPQHQIHPLQSSPSIPLLQEILT